MPFPNPPSKITPFNTGPVAPHDIGRQFDEHAKALTSIINYLRSVMRDDGVAKMSAEVLNFPGSRAGVQPDLPTGVLGPNVGGPFGTDPLGAAATAQDYAQVCIDWAEHMPDTIPLQTLAINAITGDHWSSRWWANQAALIVGSFSGAAGVREQLAVTGPNSLASLIHVPSSLAAMSLIVNGRVFSGCVTPHPFTFSGNAVTWASAAFGLNVGDEVVAAYIPAS